MGESFSGLFKVFFLYIYILGPENVELANSQWSWIEDELKNSRDQYLIVGGHFPVWSVAEHGPTKCLVERLKPLLEKYEANTYLCGHDHNLQVSFSFICWTLTQRVPMKSFT